MPARTALVTGATGFIASHLAPALVDAGWEVRTCGRRPRPDWLPPGAGYQSIDLGQDDLSELVDGVTHVFHLAGASSSKSSDEEMQRDNVVVTERLVEAATKSGTLDRFLHMSSTSVYGEEVQLPSPVPEDVRPQPSRGYGKAKWEAEQVVWRAVDEGMSGIVLRPVSVHGPGAIKLLASAILDVAIERSMGLDALAVPREPVEQRLLHITDLVNACLHLIDHDGAQGRAFNVVSGVYPTSHDVARILSEAFSMSVELDDDPDCGPSYDDRQAKWSELVEGGMKDEILLTKERFRFMRKTNRNNQLSIDALLGTGFQLQHADLATEAVADIGWYRGQRWIP